MSNKVLVIGKSGQVASCLRDLMPEAVFVGNQEWNLNELEVKGFFDHARPSVIINAAAYTAVDKAETERDAALLLNATLPKWIAEWTKENAALMVHYSTDYVYDGLTSLSHPEVEMLKPLNYYGKSKALGEEAIDRTGVQALIFRISWIYSMYGSNFVKTMIRLGLEREDLSVVNDQIGCPTSAHEVASVTLNCLKNIKGTGINGVFNYAPKGLISWFDFAEEIFNRYKILKSDLKICSLKPIKSKDYPTPAVRPLNSGLNCDKFDKQFGLERPAWQTGLTDVIRRLYGS